MPVPYRSVPKAASEGCAAYLDAVWLRSERTLYAALLLLDGRGQPLEFLYNHLVAPGGFLWPEEQVAALSVAELAHSLFAACRRDPDLLLCLDTLGQTETLRTEIAPMVPFAQVILGVGDAPTEIVWLNTPPADGSRATQLIGELQRRNFLSEPFERIHYGLREVYPQAPWPIVSREKSRRTPQTERKAP